MSKKTIMFSIFIANLLLFLTYCILEFSSFPVQQVEKDKVIVTVKCKQNIAPEEYVNILYKASEQINSDVMISFVNEDYTIDYYRTSADPSFIDLDCIDDPKDRYSTNPKNNEKKIDGFFWGSDHFSIYPLSFLVERGIDTSVMQFMILGKDVNSFSSILAEYDMEFSGMGVGIENDFSYLYMIIAGFIVFLLIAEVFYIFSCSKEIIVCKSMGYSESDIIISQLRRCGCFFVFIAVGILLMAFGISSIIFGLSSALFFVKRIFVRYFAYMIGSIVFFIIVTVIVSAKCSMADSKGKSLNSIIFNIMTVFKVIITFLLAFSMTEASISAIHLFGVLNSTEKAKNIVNGYAATELNTRLEDPMNEPEKYAARFLDFYNKLSSEHDVIYADFKDVDRFKAESQNSESEKNESDHYHDHVHKHKYEPLNIKYPTATINDSYIDKNDSIYDVTEKKIDSSVLIEGKYNILVPEKCDIDVLIEMHTRTGEITPDELNFIYYSDKSRFFTFSNEIAVSESGFCSDVICEVLDPKFIYEHYSIMSFTGTMSAMLSNSQYFSYDSSSAQTPYEQILPILKETGIDKIMVTAPDVGDLFDSNVKYYRNHFWFTAVQFVVVFISFVILLVFTTELYYKNYANDISLKLILGYSFIDIFMYRMIFKSAILPCLLFVNGINNIVALFCVAAEQLIFIICLKKNMKKNTITILKGE